MASNGDMPPAETATVNTNIVTLTRFLTEEQTKFKEATGDFTYVRTQPNPTLTTTTHTLFIVIFFFL